MVNRKGVFIGAYVPNDLKETLQRRAAAEHRTLSQEITRILSEAVHGKQLPPGMIDRGAGAPPPRARGGTARWRSGAAHGRQLPPGRVARGAGASPPRRRAVDPPERRRRGD